MATKVEVQRGAMSRHGGKQVDGLRFDAGPTPTLSTPTLPTPTSPAPTLSGANEMAKNTRRIVAMFCYEGPESAVGQFVAKTALALANRKTEVHLFAQKAFDLDLPGVDVHPVATSDNKEDLKKAVDEFTSRASNAFLSTFNGTAEDVTVVGHEWSTVPILSLLHGVKNVDTVLSLHSLERQRGGLGSDLGQWIEETELSGIREARSIIVHNPSTADVIKSCVPDSAERIVDAGLGVPMAGFHFDRDPGEVKARFDVGPVDPTILFIGDLTEHYGPLQLMKAIPSILKSNGQARCIFIGDGDLLWPLRVFSRYLMLDHAVRLAGHLGDEALYELIHAADIVAVPSRGETPWWPIEAAWVASRPVVATDQAASSLLEHEQNCLVVEPDEHSIAAGIQRILADPELGQDMAGRGKKTVERRYGDDKMIRQVERAIGLEV